MRIGLIGLLLCFCYQAYSLDFSDDFPSELKKQVTKDIDFISSIELADSTPLHNEIYGSYGGPSYIKFFADRVETLNYVESLSSGTVAFKPRNSPGIIAVTQNYTNFSHPQIARLMVLFHEARHSESRGITWLHAKCPVPFSLDNGDDVLSIWTGETLAGTYSCDKTHLGSYGSTVFLLKNIEQFCTNCSAKMKMDALIYADDNLGRVIDAQSQQKILEDSYAE